MANGAFDFLGATFAMQVQFQNDGGGCDVDYLSTTAVGGGGRGSLLLFSFILCLSLLLSSSTLFLIFLKPNTDKEYSLSISETIKITPFKKNTYKMKKNSTD